MRVRRWSLAGPAGLVAVILLAGCTSSSSDAPSGDTSSAAPSSGTSAAPSSTHAAVPPAVLSLRPKDGARDVSPLGPIKVGVADGQISSVSLRNDAGVDVGGTLSPDRRSWVAASALGYSKQYTLSAVAVNADGATVRQSAAFSTLTPDRFTMPYFETTGRGAMRDGATYGIGMVTSVHWDESIVDKKAAERTLSVKTTPTVAGAWYWMDDQNVHWRPRTYFRPGTKVTVSVKPYGVEVGPGLYGEADKSTSFAVGESHVSVADDNDKQVKVYIGGRLARSMPTSMGRGGTQTIKGRVISYWTQRGTYTVLDKSNPVLMDSTTYGLPQSKGGYKEYINWATRISTDGVYLHELTSTVWAQGHQNLSHGCLNLNPESARWFFGLSRPGDVVTVKNTGGSPLEVWQNGDWSAPWPQWVAGGALH